MDVDVVERHLVHEVQPDHHHPRDPEEDDVEAGDEHGRSGSSASTSGVSSGQPSVENGHSADENQVSRTSSSRRQASSRRAVVYLRPASCARLASVSLDEDVAIAVRTTPGSDGPTRAGAKCTTAGCCASTRNRSSPSSAARTASCPSSTAAIAGFASVVGIDVPLVGQERLDRRRSSGRRAARHALVGSIFASRPAAAMSATICLARSEPIQPAIGFRNIGSLGIVAIDDPPVSVEHVDHARGRDACRPRSR